MDVEVDFVAADAEIPEQVVVQGKKLHGCPA